MAPAGYATSNWIRGASEGRFSRADLRYGDKFVATGTVKWFSEEKGFGFILPDEGGNDLFVHRSNVKTDNQTLRDDQRVEFEIGEGRKGPEATEVRPI